ncbi:hypothetical protein [Parasulfitobacter algicola]|uniref:Uncharacterized protein n=1 Tax=Parasulfitobacter algicola TaxID=2614809 RepID=A0ABX2J140_9RHOB|nr:hypothetical protein [Sulfitobacter algicola]NSX56923.1 hypothetical protein [Sulfitobacter algicola]
MLKGLLDKLNANRRYTCAEKFVSENRYKEALELLYDYEGPPLYVAKSVLLSAVAQHRNLDFKSAYKLYSKFLNFHINDISRSNDRDYLELYAKYFRDYALKEFDQTTELCISRNRLLELQKRATLATRGEFPIID